MNEYSISWRQSSRSDHCFKRFALKQKIEYKIKFWFLTFLSLRNTSELILSWYLRKSLANTSLSSICANLIPIQFRGPKPNVWKAIEFICERLSEENLKLNKFQVKSFLRKTKIFRLNYRFVEFVRHLNLFDMIRNLTVFLLKN